MQLDTCIRFIQPKAKNYHKLIGLMIAVAKKHIPRGFRKKYIPGWSENSQSLYEKFEDSGDPESAEHLLRSLDASRMDKWTSAVECMNFARQYHRLKSRHPSYRSALESNENFHVTNKWITIWAETAGDHYIQLDDPTQCFNGSDLPHRLWSKINRVRTGCGKCADSSHKWGRAESPQCDCGSPRQTIRHIISECPNRSYDYDLGDSMKATPEAIEWLRNLDVDI
ncbi:hypothetical protein JTB14_035894 [Gonioctena quinquepunctata]|nr:hypothetical protein JTB14_035894 [Gonioctena quinquepunctata]